MKKLLLSLTAFVAFTSLAQVEITELGSATLINGTTLTYTLDHVASFEHMYDLDVKNTSGNDGNYVVTRHNITNPTGWSSQFCWSGNVVFGQCYPVSTSVDQSSNAETVQADSVGILSIYINAPDAGTGLYRYYIATGGNVVDSVDIMVSSSASLEEVAALTVNVAPNPATDHITIKTNSNSTNIIMSDVLGNIVYEEKNVSGTKKLNVNDFRNGVYFVRVEAEGTKPVTRKVIVKH